MHVGTASPETGTQEGVEAIVLLCSRSPYQANGTSIMSCPSDGIGFAVVMVNVRRERVDM